MIGLPNPDLPEHEAHGPEVRCTECGYYNDAREQRCDRCGLPLDSRRRIESRRELELAESLPAPTPERAPKLPPAPEWKHELDQRLAGYRGRTGQPPQESALEDREDVPALPKSKGTALPPPRARDLEESVRQATLPPPRRAANAAQQPPIIDRRDLPASAQPRRDRARSGAPAAASLSLRAVAGLMDLGVALAALGVFLGALLLINTYVLYQDPLATQSRLQLIIGCFCALLVFYWYFYLRFLGRTAGMAWAGLRVVNIDGEDPTESQRRMRAVGTALSAAALGVGFLWALSDEQRLTWHDRISKTLVVVDD
jgi:uncharacterized RDD family membrane protein YckC